MQIILLSAGQSSRMAPLSDKALLKICWKSIIEHQIDNIIYGWFRDFLIVCNNENIEKIKEIWWRKKWIRFNYVIQEVLKDWMKWAIESCGKLAQDNVFIVSSNDIVEKSLFKKMFIESQKKWVYWVICGKVVNKYFPWGYISKDNNNNLINIVEKPWEWKEPSNQINLVLHIWNNFKDFQNKVLNFHNSTDDAYEKTIQNICKEWMNKIKIFEYLWFWQAVKYPWHILKLTEYFLGLQKNKISKDLKKGKNVIIKGKWVVVEKWVQIFENSILSGPCYIWENTIIGNNVLIRQSSIWNNVLIGFWSEIWRSCLQEKIRTHNNYLWDSVIDSNVSFGAWTITWNLRLDEWEISIEIKGEKIKTQTNKLWSIIGKNCRIWINTSLNPWLKIWENSFIAWWITIWENVNKDSFIYWDIKLVKKKNLKTILGD